MKKILFTMTMLALGLISAQANAGTLTIEDGNSTAIINTQGGQEDIAGMHTWQVDGQDVLALQWFWVRVIGDNNEVSIDKLALLDEGTIDANAIFGDTRDEKAVTVYMDQQQRYTIEVEYELTGGSAGSGTAQIAELIRITNNTSEALSLSFFQYSDFDLGGSENNSVLITNGNTATQTGPGAEVNESVVTPTSSAFEAGLFPDTLNKLEDNNADNLNGVASAEGDVTWAFQWDMTLSPVEQAGNSFLISKIKNVTIIPEPSSLALFGLAGLCFTRRRKA